MIQATITRILYETSAFEAQKAFEADEVPVGAVIVCNNKIIARTHNLTERLTDFTAHAEMQALLPQVNT